MSEEACRHCTSPLGTRLYLHPGDALDPEPQVCRQEEGRGFRFLEQKLSTHTPEDWMGDAPDATGNQSGWKFLKVAPTWVLGTEPSPCLRNSAQEEAHVL